MSDAKSSPRPDRLAALRADLARWYEVQRRPLPWRTQASLYRTVVSEFMCQQTQIDTVLPYFARWMEWFPDFAALAQAPEAKVLKAWEGLGYYARARNLHRLAQHLAALPAPPTTPAAWQALPGIGPYTAAAICSIAFDHPAAVVDGNVIRVLARLHAIDEAFAGNQAASKAIQPLADALLDGSRPGDHNQALMELGATVCTKHRPSCLLCPLREHCLGYREGDPAALPRIRRRATEKVTLQRVWVVHEGRLLLQTGTRESKRLATLAELPLASGLLELNGRQPWAVRTRGISHQRITEEIHYLRWTPALGARIEEASRALAWHPLDQLDELTLSGPHKRWIRELRAEPVP